MKKILLSISCIGFSLFYSQKNQVAVAPGNPVDPSLVLFRYDNAGNQIYRGPDGIVCVNCRPGEEIIPPSLADQIANKIQAAPVPVKTNLTVIWDLSITDFIVSIDLLPYNASNITETVNITSLNTNSYLFRMSHLPYGVYYLKFNLTDGSVYTRTVTKN